MIQDDIWTLLARRLSGEATPEELQQLEQLLAQDPALATTAQQITDTWHDTAKNDTQKALDAFAKIDAQIQSQKELAPVYQLSRPSWFSKYRIAVAAAAIVLLAGAAFIFLQNNTGNKEVKPLALQNFITPAKTIRHITMTDGTKIWLNENSKLEYGDKYNDKTREVWLTGEAYFDVTKNEKKPFIIHTQAVNVKVLGTAFNIKSYPGEKMVETSLIRGSVEVSLASNPSKVYLLKPNQKLVVPVADTSSVDSLPASAAINKEIKYGTIGKVADNLSSDTIIAETSWIDQKLAFYESSFKDLAVRLERRYNVEFVFKDPRKEAIVFTEVFYQQTLSQALRALSLTASFHYQVKDSIVYIY